MKVYVLLMVCVALVCADEWQPVDDALQEGIDTYAYPGCVGLIANAKGVLYWRAFGNYTYGAPPPLNNGANPPVQTHTLFDLASVSKVTGATTAAALLYQKGQLDLDQTVSDILGSDFSQNGKAPITVRNCLLHNAGFPPDPSPNYWDPSFGCPETANQYPAENFSCQTKVWNSLMAQTLENPVGSTYVYSDLSFITLMFVIGHKAKELNYVSDADIIPSCNTGGPGIDQCYYEAFVRKYVFEEIGMHHTGYLPPQAEWPLSTPCENDTTYLNRVIQGQVSDGNAYAMGGIAGHAGLFSNAADLEKLVSMMMFSSQHPNPLLNATTVKYFTTEYNHTQSCRALGWSTNDPDAYDYGWSLACGNLSATTWTHIGYTGTQICADPEREIFTIFLTNRVYPTSDNNQMLKYRQAFNNAAMQVVDSMGHAKRGTYYTKKDTVNSSRRVFK